MNILIHIIMAYNLQHSKSGGIKKMKIDSTANTEIHNAHSFQVNKKSSDDFVLSKEDIEAILKYHKKKEQNTQQNNSNEKNTQESFKSDSALLDKELKVDFEKKEKSEKAHLEPEENDFVMVGQFIDIYA